MTDMKYAPLGWSGIKVSKVCLGGMSFGKTSPDFHQWTIDQQGTEQAIGHAIDRGINFIDTANRYAFGTSEEYIGQALRNLNIERDQVVLASKVYFNDGHLSKEAINYEIDGTLKRLDTDYLEEPYTAHELVGPLSRPGEKALAGTLAPTLKETTRN